MRNICKKIGKYVGNKCYLGCTESGRLVSLQVDIDMYDPDACFELVPGDDTQYVSSYTGAADSRRPHTASVIINVGERAHFQVVFRPTLPQRSQANIRLSVVSNQYEDSVIQLVGEGYHDDITIDNIRSLESYQELETMEGTLAEDDVAGTAL